MFTNKLFVVGDALIALALAVWPGPPRLLNGLGLHAHYDIPSMDLRGKRALIITTSQDTLGDTVTATGVLASEMTVPYYPFSAAETAVDVTRIQGGPIPIEPSSLGWG